MPDTLCPRCHALLREEDCGVWGLPFDSAWDRHKSFMFHAECWACSWEAQWRVPELSRPEVKALS